MRYKIKWDDLAQKQLREACNYIKKDSVANAEKVRKKILATSMSLKAQPEKYPVDKYKIDNDGSYRNFIVYRYRVSYRVTETEITILRLRHASMEPLEY